MRRRRLRGPPSLVGVVAGVLCIVAGLLLPEPGGAGVRRAGRRAAWAGPAGQLAVRVLRLGRGFDGIHQRPVLDRAARPGSCRTAQPRRRQRGALPARLRRNRHARCSAWGRYRRESCHAQVARFGGCGRTTEISVRYLVENLSISGAGQIRSYVLGAVAGLAAVGYVRASEI